MAAGRAALLEREGWLTVESIQPLLARLDAVREALHHAGGGSSSPTCGSSCRRRSTRTASTLLGTLACAVAGDTPQRTVIQWILDPQRLRSASLTEAEQAAREASILRWFALQYPGVAGVTIEKAAALEEAAAARVVQELRAEIDAPTIGRCRACDSQHGALGEACATAASWRAATGAPLRPGRAATWSCGPYRSTSCVQRKSAIGRPSESLTVASQICVVRPPWTSCASQ